MNKTLTTLGGCLLATTPLIADDKKAETPSGTQIVYVAGAQPASAGPEQYFTGSVRVFPAFPQNEHTTFSGAYVTFQPSARSAWHRHPAGQHIVVTDGVALTGTRDGKVVTLKTGDAVWCPPGVEHWHGAAPDQAMTHFVVTGSKDGQNVVWLEKVSDADYQPPSVAARTATAPTPEIRIQQPNTAGRRLSPADVSATVPALENYTQERLYGEVWNRPGLSKRDRSLATIATLIARGQSGALNYDFDQAIENGVKPAEISETILHLAFYSGWGNAFGAVGPARDVFAKRGIGADLLPAISGAKLPLDEMSEAQRAARVGEQFGSVAPGVVGYTTDILFRDLWLRPGLAPRDRSLVTVSALIAAGDSAQVGYHLGRAMDNGLTQVEAGEVITHLAFYAGWPKAFSALPVVKEVFEKRAK